MNRIPLTCFSPSLMTPLSIISLYKSLPSRVRSPTPANTEKPPNQWNQSAFSIKKIKENVNKNKLIARTMSFSNIVNKFHDKHSFSYTSTTKQPNLSSSLIWCKQVNNLKYKFMQKNEYPVIWHRETGNPNNKEEEIIWKVKHRS